MTAVVVGVVFIVIGGWGIVHWSPDFLTALRGFGPLSIFIGGFMSLIAGISSFRPPRANGDKKD